MTDLLHARISSRHVDRVVHVAHQAHDFDALRDNGVSRLDSAGRAGRLKHEASTNGQQHLTPPRMDAAGIERNI